MITTKNDLIKYFESGIKNNNQIRIGVEHEKFIFDLDKNKRVNYKKLIKMFEEL